MIAIDTNVVVRIIVIDDAAQSARARALIESTPVSVSLTVILETGWVLASRYRLPPKEIVAALDAFLGLPGVTADDPVALHRALAWVLEGLDFADALHLSQVSGPEGFATFDGVFARLGSRLADVPVSLL